MDRDVIDLFHELASRSPSEREACYTLRQTPAAIRAEVESLLRVDALSGPSLSSYVWAAAEGGVLEGDVAPAGTRYGSYRLIRLLGRGGMGAVYEAEQDSPRRVVALKVIKPGLAGAHVERRFAQEAQALAWVFHGANEKYATDYPAAIGNRMTNTDSTPFMDLVPAISLRENERGTQIGSGWDPHWHQPTDLFTTFSDKDFRLGLNAAQTTLGAIAQLTGASMKK